MKLTVADNDTGALIDGIGSHLICEIVGDEHDGLLLAGLLLVVADEQANIVPCAVGDFLGISSPC